jgi:threonine dehydrogenase-like Zn-dependent dehydrogenase
LDLIHFGPFDFPFKGVLILGLLGWTIPMKASVYYGKGDIRIEKVPDPKIQDPTDAVVRITHACICGSDLWFYRGEEPDWKPGFRTGHEWMGIVEEVGRDVRTVNPIDM